VISLESEGLDSRGIGKKGVRVVYRTGPFVFDAAERELRRDGALLEAQPKVLAALEVFLDAPGRLLSRKELLDRLWPGLFVGEEALTQTIRKLRLVLGDDAESPTYVQTVLKGGYRFVAPVERLEVSPDAFGSEPAPDAPPLSLEPAAPPAATPRASPGRFALRVAAGVLLVAAIAAALALRSRSPLETPASEVWSAEPQRLTASPALEIQPAISPDGELVAYSAAPGAGIPPGELDLWLLSLEGGEPLRLTSTPLDEWGARFRRDGREILFLRGAPGDYDVELRALPVFGGAERRIAPAAGSADWSPDGSEVALARHAGEGYEIVRRRIEDGAERRLATLEETPHSLVWSPDGRHLAFLAGRRHWVLDAEGGAPRPVAPEANAERGLAWDGDDALLSNAAWGGRDRRIARLPLDGEPEALLRTFAGAAEPALAVGGSALVFVGESKQRELWRLAPDGTGATAIAAPSTVEGFDIDAAGGQLALLDWEPTPARTPLVRQRLPRGGSENLGDGLCPALSPDGTLLATLDLRPGEGGLVVVDLASGVRRKLADDAGPPGALEENLHRCPAFSPDGRRIATELLFSDGSAALTVLEVDGGAPRRVAPGRHERPAWSPDGLRLATCPLSDGNDRKVRVHDLGSGAETALPIDCPFRAGPVWDREGTLWVLTDQKKRPTLVGYSGAGDERARLPLALPIDPSFWGVFEVRRTDDGSWWVLVERYTADLFLLRPRGS